MHLATYSKLMLYTYYQYVCSLGIEPRTFCAANAMLYHWATGTEQYMPFIIYYVYCCNVLNIIYCFTKNNTV